MLKRLLLVLPPWTLTVIVSLLIAYLTLVPHPLPDNDIQWFTGADKVVHAIMFGALAAAIDMDYARRRHTTSLSVRILILSFVIATCAGVLIETLQLITAMGRSFEAWDIVADTIGAATGAILSTQLVKLLN